MMLRQKLAGEDFSTSHTMKRERKKLPQGGGRRGVPFS
jgi:hypothetical protein